MAKKVPSRLRRTTRKRKRPIKRAASSGRVHLYVGISLDGYIAAPDGGVDWLNI